MGDHRQPDPRPNVTCDFPLDKKRGQAQGLAQVQQGGMCHYPDTNFGIFHRGNVMKTVPPVYVRARSEKVQTITTLICTHHFP